MSAASLAFLTVHARPMNKSRGFVRFGMKSLPCALGKGGIRTIKREGDGATPRGTLRVLQLYRRPDRPMVKLRFPLRFMAPNMAWCDDPRSSRYNQPVTLPFTPSHERLWREDHLYDLVIDTDYNRRPAIKGRGSAIFIHLARPNYLPTEGCIAFNRRDLALLLAMIDRHTRIHVR